MVLPIMEIERFGYIRQTTIWSGVVELAADGLVIVAIIVFLCSIVIPILKIAAIFVLCSGDWILHATHRAWTYRTLDWIGRWGMVDVLLVAVLIAIVKLGNWVQMRPGAGAVAFTAVVILSLLSSAAFDPTAIWNENDPGSKEPIR
jgi:paraquat-inducible protein A